MTDRYRDRPFSDSDHGRDDYGREPQPRGAQPRPAESDPLAELARLIGQTDPFSTFGREAQGARGVQGGAQAYPDDAASEPSYDDEPPSQPSWMRNRAPAPQPPRDAYEDRYSADPYGAPQRGYDEAPRSDPMTGFPRALRGVENSHYDDVLFGPAEQPEQQVLFDPQNDDYRDEPFTRPQFADQLDDDAPKARRGGTMTVVVVLLLAVVGTASAFAYRTFIGSPRSGEPPVIKADAGPNKVVPANSGSGKQITDRVGEKPAERVVSREEQPLDVNGKPQPRVVFPPLTPNSNPPTAASASPSARPTGAGVGNGTLGGDEPRRIRTLAIRPDGSDSAAVPSVAPAAAAPPNVQRQAPPPPAPAAPSSTATAQPSANAPIALTPQGQTSTAEARPRVASVSPPPSNGNGNGSGSYVQVSSQKTEADAQASYRALQAKYSDILGSRSSSIRRADLGDKGVYYRALVGPFATTDEATQFCVNLKSAGGQCIVQR